MSKKNRGRTMARKRSSAKRANPKSADAPMRFKILQDKPNSQQYMIIPQSSSPIEKLKVWLSRQSVR